MTASRNLSEATPEGRRGRMQNPAPSSGGIRTNRQGHRRLSGAVVGKLLGLLAAPTFMAMAALTIASDYASPMMCSASPLGPLLGGMGGMYLLMAAFHLPPWLRAKPTRHAKPSDRR